MSRKKSEEATRTVRSESLTVVLSHRQVAQLDSLSVDIRLKHRRAISRAEIIRGIIHAAMLTRIDLSDASSSEGIVALFRAWRALQS